MELNFISIGIATHVSFASCTSHHFWKYTVNKEASSKNNLHSLFSTIDMSLMYIRNKKDQAMEPWVKDQTMEPWVKDQNKCEPK